MTDAGQALRAISAALANEKPSVVQDCPTEKRRFDALKEDIAKRGLIEPIVTDQFGITSFPTTVRNGRNGWHHLGPALHAITAKKG